MNTELLKKLPQVEEILQHPTLKDDTNKLPHEVVVEVVRSEIDSLRHDILNGEEPVVDKDAIAKAVHLRNSKFDKPSLRPVINASGVVIHTNLGRSVLAPEAVKAVNEVIKGYSTLEYNLDTMARGSRHNHCEKLLSTITGAEAAIAVNNNAAAVMMVLNEFASGHEAIVSRGELIEIGGSFRIPDIMKLSNATMVEVGTTNKTHPSDYENALTQDTAMLLKVHPSNYRITGFTENVSLEKLRILADAARENGINTLVYEDQGSGTFANLDCFGQYREAPVRESIEQGADLVSFSGDKLLGGPQAGIIVGRKDLIDRLKKNPLARALRLDKMTLAALEATLRLYLDPEKAEQNIPTVRMLKTTADEIKPSADSLADLIKEKVTKSEGEISVVETISRAGGGALPMCDIPSYGVQINFIKGQAEGCRTYLIQQLDVPIVARVQNDMLLFDPRTLVSLEEYQAISDGVRSYFDSL